MKFKAISMLTLTVCILALTACNVNKYYSRLVPEPGYIFYAFQHTQSDFMGVDGIDFELISSDGDVQDSLSLPLQSKPGWQTAHLYYQPQCPRWSPDESVVAFNDGKNVTVYTPRGNQLETIQLDYDLVWNITWSPDGSKLAFSGNPTVGQTTIWTIDLKTQIVERLTECTTCRSPAWKPNGDAIAYIDVYRQIIAVVDPINKAVIAEYPIDNHLFPLTTESPLIAWSPDGKLIAFSAVPSSGSDSQVFILALDSGEFQRISSRNEWADSPAWSPSGKQLLFRVAEFSKQTLADEEPVRKVTNLVIVAIDNPSKRFELTSFDAPDFLITCPQWLLNSP